MNVRRAELPDDARFHVTELDQPCEVRSDAVAVEFAEVGYGLATHELEERFKVGRVVAPGQGSKPPLRRQVRVESTDQFPPSCRPSPHNRRGATERAPTCGEFTFW